MLQDLQYAHNWLTNGHSIVLAVVTKTWGSAPRPVGSVMIIHEDGHFEGSVSGGCVEGTVIAEALALMQSKTSKTLEFSVATSDAWTLGLACGGQINIQLFPLGEEDIDAFKAAIDHLQRRIAGRLTLSKASSPAVFKPNQHSETSHFSVNETEQDLTIAICPPPKLYIVGAVHIAQALTPMATACGYEVKLIDPRAIFIEERTFGGAEIIQDWPDEYLAKSPLDAQCALVTLTHDPKIDDAALGQALASDAFYIGSLGSKKTHAARLERLSEHGFSDIQLARINGPIGLNIGSKLPAEIAVSIIAQLTANFRGEHEV